MDYKGNKVTSEEVHQKKYIRRSTSEEVHQKKYIRRRRKKKEGRRRMEEEKKLNDILKQIDTQSDYNESEALDNYFYSNYIVEY